MVIKLQTDMLWTIFFILMLVFFLISMLGNMLQQRERKQREKIVTYTIIACIKGDYEEKREFMPGDFVGKIIKDKKCPRDNEDLRIKAIYAEKQPLH
ncbi:MAG: hypothetical protein RQ885_03085 [Desulfurococcales archaeon]|nr:hypothetical protein [Desulfurococcales archaeon]